MRLKKVSLPVLDRIRLMKRTSCQAIKAIKNANSVDELMNTYSINGKCLMCGKETILIKNTGYCVNCSLKNKKGLFKKKAMIGVCVNCGVEGLVSKETNECFNCLAKKL